MIRECLGLFCENLTQKGERYILDNYVPKDGTYMFITMADEMWNISEPLDIIYDKKKGVLDGRDSPKYLDFCFLDYYSKLIDMNKPKDREVKLYVGRQAWFTGKMGIYKKNVAIRINRRLYDEDDPEKDELSEEELLAAQGGEEPALGG